MRVYLDNCCYNRPYDDQSQMRISLEAQAKLYIQGLIRSSQMELVSSYVLRYELSRNPNPNIKDGIQRFIDEFSYVYVSEKNNEEIEKIALEIKKTGIKKMDALHVACAIYSKAEYFLSTDDRLLKYKTDKIKVENPMTFIREMEVEND